MITIIISNTETPHGYRTDVARRVSTTDERSRMVSRGTDGARPVSTTADTATDASRLNGDFNMIGMIE
jgi:hypothetical protein